MINANHNIQQQQNHWRTWFVSGVHILWKPRLQTDTSLYGQSSVKIWNSRTEEISRVGQKMIVFFGNAQLLELW